MGLQFVRDVGRKHIQALHLNQVMSEESPAVEKALLTIGIADRLVEHLPVVVCNSQFLLMCEVLVDAGSLFARDQLVICPDGDLLLSELNRMSAECW